MRVRKLQKDGTRRGRDEDERRVLTRAQKDDKRRAGQSCGCGEEEETVKTEETSQRRSRRARKRSEREGD